jgi:hypothetical protein
MLVQVSFPFVPSFFVCMRVGLFSVHARVFPVHCWLYVCAHWLMLWVLAFRCAPVPAECTHALASCHWSGSDERVSLIDSAAALVMWWCLHAHTRTLAALHLLVLLRRSCLAPCGLASY